MMVTVMLILGVIAWIVVVVYAEVRSVTILITMIALPIMTIYFYCSEHIANSQYASTEHMDGISVENMYMFNISSPRRVHLFKLL